MSLDPDALARLQERLGVTFKDVSRLERALTHRSAAVADGRASYERLEFLGDAVVGLIISEALFRQFPDQTEGDLAKSKAYVVSEAALSEAAVALGFDEFLVLSAGESASGGRLRRSTLADTFEAIAAAIFLDRGMLAARRFVLGALREAIRTVTEDEHRRDYKSALQQRAQAQLRATPYYRIVAQAGDEHDKTFTAHAMVGESVVGEGDGKTKKDAEQAAAQNALRSPERLDALLAARRAAAEGGREPTPLVERATQSAAGATLTQL